MCMKSQEDNLCILAQHSTMAVENWEGRTSGREKAGRGSCSRQSSIPEQAQVKVVHTKPAVLLCSGGFGQGFHTGARLTPSILVLCFQKVWGAGYSGQHQALLAEASFGNRYLQHITQGLASSQDKPMRLTPCYPSLRQAMVKHRSLAHLSLGQRLSSVKHW
jgi:hypothetical protein